MQNDHDIFKDALYSMPLGERIVDNGKPRYGFDWIITRVPGGWIYTNERGQGHSVFVPVNDEFLLPF